jgi:hypothetical protein
MPAPIIDGLITYLSVTTGANVWDGEVQRTSPSGLPVNPETLTVPSVWPAIKVFMPEGGFNREWTTEDPYTDTGEILIQIWDTARVGSEALMNTIETLFAQAAVWAQIPLGGDPQNPYYIIQMLLLNWYSGQEEGVRTGLSQFLYRCDLRYEVMIHGAIVTL